LIRMMQLVEGNCFGFRGGIHGGIRNDKWPVRNSK
jgi:hypothetical protein